MSISSRKDLVLIVATTVVLLGAGGIWFATGGMGGGGNPDFPEGHPYVCVDCGQATVLSDDELFDLKVSARESGNPDADQVVCSSCGSVNTVPAVKCPHCGKYFARPVGRPVCPFCKEPFPSPFGGG